MPHARQPLPSNVLLSSVSFVEPSLRCGLFAHEGQLLVHVRLVSRFDGPLHALGRKRICERHPSSVGFPAPPFVLARAVLERDVYPEV